MSLSVALLALALVAGAQGGSVVDLNNYNFLETIRNNKIVIVEFVAAWCGHCKRLMPEFARAAEQNTEEGIVFGSIDCQVEHALVEKYQIQGFPTVKIFRKGEFLEDYTGERSADAIYRHVMARADPPVRHLLTVDDARAFVNQVSDRAVVVGYFDESSAFYHWYLAFSSRHRTTYTFAIYAQSQYYHLLAAQPETVVLYQQHEETRVYGHGFDDDSLQLFLQENTVQRLEELNQHNYKTYFRTSVPILLVFIDYSNVEESNRIKSLFKPIIARYASEFVFGYINGIKYLNMAKKFGLTGTSLPAFVLETEGGEHYTFEDMLITDSAVTSFLNRFKNGLLRPTIRSQPLPLAVFDDKVKVIVGSTIDEDVLNTWKDVLFLLYAPWCGHSKAFLPTLVHIAKTLSNNPNIVIAKMDATQNDAPGFIVKGYPTLYLVNGEKSKIPFTGARSLEEIVKFIQENAKFKLTSEEVNKLVSNGSPPEDSDEDVVLRDEFLGLKRIVLEQTEKIAKLEAVLEQYKLKLEAVLEQDKLNLEPRSSQHRDEL